MSTEDRDDEDPLQSLIVEILEAVKSGNTVDRDALLKQHPEDAESLRDFFADHDRMKATASLKEPTVPPSPVVARLLYAVVLLLVVSTSVSIYFAINASFEAHEALLAKRESDIQRQLVERGLYRNQLAQALAELKNGDFDSAETIIDRCRWDLRGWEHDYVNTQVTNREQEPFQEIAEIKNNNGILERLVIWPDASRVSLSTSRQLDDNKCNVLYLSGEVAPATGYRWLLAISPNGKRAISHEDASLSGGAYHRFIGNSSSEAFKLGRNELVAVTHLSIADNGEVAIVGSSGLGRDGEPRRMVKIFDAEGNGLPEPESDDPTQWLFHGWPAVSTCPLHVAVARLLGYRWPAELDSEMRLSDRARQLVSRCNELDSFVDEDGIVCIPHVRGEDVAADRLRSLLNACGVSSDENLDDWLRNRFFKEHCDLFDHRPFVWHIWDGRKQDGFHALVNYHKLAGPRGHKVLERLTYSYLGDWIERREDEVKRNVSGAEARLLAARGLRERLEAILAGEPPYDIFVRWKPITEQPIGWNPDINDGVRINIRPFMAVDIPGGQKGAGILRVAPKRMKWGKDRGKEPKRPIDEYPWFWSWDEKTEDFTGGDKFDGLRWNDCHYTNRFKQAARSRTEPTALAAGLPTETSNANRPEASAYGSEEPRKGS